jgi:hypothetical protein
LPSSAREQIPLDLKYNSNGHAELRDAAAAENKSLPVHRWVPWIAGFSAQFVEDAIEAFLPRRAQDKQVVLDPFAGVGTTLIEAVKSGRSAIGYEINPFAALAAEVKANCIDVNAAGLGRNIEDFRSRLCALESQIDRAWTRGGASAVGRLASRLSHKAPSGFKSRVPFFSPPVEAKFLAALDLVSSLRAPYRSLFQVALGSTMVSFSNYTYEPSLSSRPGAGKPLIENAPVARVICSKLDNMLDDTRLVQTEYGRAWKRTARHVTNATYFEAALPARSVSLLVTSPPYMNNYHYVRNTRPQLHWLGLIGASNGLRAYEDESFGKFWQTVRQAPSPGLTSKLTSVKSLVERLHTINVDRAPYGGPGWANYVTTYFNDCERFITKARQQLRPGSRAVIVVGNSIIQGIEFKVDQLFAELAEDAGFAVESVHRVRDKRVGNSIIDSSVRNGNGDGHKARTQLYDAAVVLRR